MRLGFFISTFGELSNVLVCLIANYRNATADLTECLLRCTRSVDKSMSLNVWLSDHIAIYLLLPEAMVKTSDNTSLTKSQYESRAIELKLTFPCYSRRTQGSNSRECTRHALHGQFAAVGSLQEDEAMRKDLRSTLPCIKLKVLSSSLILWILWRHSRVDTLELQRECWTNIDHISPTITYRTHRSLRKNKDYLLLAKLNFNLLEGQYWGTHSSNQYVPSDWGHRKQTS